MASNIPLEMLDYWWILYFSACSILGITGNLTTVCILFLKKSLRTVSNCLIGHLALVDLIIGGPIVLSNLIRYFPTAHFICSH